MRDRFEQPERVYATLCVTDSIGTCARESSRRKIASAQKRSGVHTKIIRHNYSANGCSELVTAVQSNTGGIAPANCCQAEERHFLLAER